MSIRKTAFMVFSNNNLISEYDLLLSKENLEQLISAKDTSFTFSKQNEKDHTFKVWSHFSKVFVNNKKQDFILFSICCNNYAYSYFESWKTNKLLKEENLDAINLDIEYATI